jgi:hypothetical protein
MIRYNTVVLLMAAAHGILRFFLNFEIVLHNVIKGTRLYGRRDYQIVVCLYLSHLHSPSSH